MQNEFDTIKTSVVKVVDSSIAKVITTTSYDLSHQSSIEIILEYTRTLIWPIIILIIFLVYRKRFERLFDRIVNESEEISSSFLGIGAKFRQNVLDVTNSSSDSNKVKDNIDKIVRQSYLDEFKLLSSYFITKSFSIRKKIAITVSKLSQNLELDDLLTFASSSLPGERIGAFIGIKAHINLTPGIEKNEKIIEAVRVGLDDGYSRVRYRVIQVISESKYLIGIFKEELASLLIEENNASVKEEIQRVLSK